MDYQTAVGASKDYTTTGIRFYSQGNLTDNLNWDESDSFDTDIEDRFQALAAIYSQFPHYVPEPINLVTDESGNPTGYMREEIKAPSLKNLLKSFDLALDKHLACRIASDIDQMVEQLHLSHLDHSNLRLDQIILPLNYLREIAGNCEQYYRSTSSQPKFIEPLNLTEKIGHKQAIEQDIKSLAFIKEILEID